MRLEIQRRVGAARGTVRTNSVKLATIGSIIGEWKACDVGKAPGGELACGESRLQRPQRRHDCPRPR